MQKILDFFTDQIAPVTIIVFFVLALITGAGLVWNGAYLSSTHHLIAGGLFWLEALALLHILTDNI